jgi:hypothetical protein
MRRWTDGRRWGASRVGGGGFLVYAEYAKFIPCNPRRLMRLQIVRLALAASLSVRLASWILVQFTSIFGTQSERLLPFVRLQLEKGGKSR